MEISNLSGNISQAEGKLLLQSAYYTRRKDYTALAGHLLDAKIRGAGEFFVYPINSKVFKVKNEDVGLYFLMTLRANSVYPKSGTMNRREMLRLSLAAALIGTAMNPNEVQATQTVARNPYLCLNCLQSREGYRAEAFSRLFAD